MPNETDKKGSNPQENSRTPRADRGGQRASRRPAQGKQQGKQQGRRDGRQGAYRPADGPKGHGSAGREGRPPHGDQGKGKQMLHIAKLDDDLCGVAYIGADRYVVAGALPDEDVLVEVTQTVGTVHLCRLMRVVAPSPHRVRNDCAAHGCGGCALRHMAYDYQLQAKTALVKRKLLPVYGGEVAPCMPAEGLRNKVHLVFGTATDPKGKTRVTVGFFDAETHAVVDAPTCPAHGRWYAAVAGALRVWAQKSGNTIYDPATGQGDLRFAVVRHLSGSTMVTVVARRMPAAMDALYEGLARLGGRVSLWYNHNDRRTNEVFGPHCRWVAGVPKLQGEMLGLTFGLRPDSFFQTNTAMARNAYRLVQQMVGTGRPVLDLFCGIGITSVLFAMADCTVVGVESSVCAIEDATQLADRAAVQDKVRFCAGLVQEVLPTLPICDNEAIFVDPPRAGLGEEVCRAILARNAADLVYMSCNVATLATDLALLCPTYTVRRVVPLDMFPNTTHCEVIVQLRRNDSDA